MANDGVVFLLVLLQEILGAGEGHLVDVALHLIGGHADAVVADGERFGFAIHTDPDGPVIPFTAITGHRRHAALADGVNAIAHQLPQKHLMAGINGLLNDWENVLPKFRKVVPRDYEKALEKLNKKHEVLLK